ncbi:MAG TPA: hypothetical protein VEJ86_11010, partial [Candidatus Binataceae bacterium]|nr:hypothetical protein [Candidatus Binataceae bacterium]
TMILSDLMYAYMFAISAIVVWVISLARGHLRQSFARSVARLAIVMVPAAIISSYLTVPFVLEGRFLNASAYLESWKYDSYGARAVLGAFASGQLFDHGRLPVVTVLVAIGLAAGVYRAIVHGRPDAKLTVLLFVVWMSLFFGRATFGRLADLLPLSQRVLFHRFSGGVDFAAILAIGLGAEWIWDRLYWLSTRPRTIIVTALLIVFLVPALAERWSFYGENRSWMQSSYQALQADSAFPRVLGIIRSLPPGRVYAGTRNDWASARAGVSFMYSMCCRSSSWTRWRRGTVFR